MIEVETLSFSRSGAPVLRDVSVTIPAEGITAIIGPNGAGKSTLLHCIAGLLKPEAGRIRVNGTDVHRVRERERAALMALLTQAQGAVPRLTVADLVSFGRWPHHRGRPGPEDHKAVADAMARFDLDPFADRDVEALSGGQRQRAFVAMAYAQTTPWMLLDEPLSALDPKYARDIMERLGALARAGAQKRAVALVLHDIQIALQHASWFVCLKDGTVAHAGPVDSVTSDILSDLYDTPLRLETVADQKVVVAA